MADPPRRTWAYVLFGTVVGLLIISSGVFVIVRAVGEMGPGADARLGRICMTRIAKAAKAQLLYSADHDDKLPPAGAWVDATWSYGPAEGRKGQRIDPAETNESVFRCPTISGLRAGGYGFAFNVDLGTSSTTQESPEETPLLFDSRQLTRNSAGKPEDLLPVPLRHSSNTLNVMAFLDGSARPVFESKPPFGLVKVIGKP